MEEEIKGTKQEFIKLFRQLCYSRSAWQVWSDLISCMACSIANAFDYREPAFSKREEEFKQCTERLGGVEIPAKCMAVIVQALERNPNQDFLGALYMELELGNHWKGQFFTPYSLCECMAGMNVSDELLEKIKRQGFITVNDPSCGAGATLVAFANTMHLKGVNYQEHVMFVGQDIDRIVAMMCFIQLSLLGCPGYIVVADTLTDPIVGNVLRPDLKESQEGWFMPGYFNKIQEFRFLSILKKVDEPKILKHNFYFYFDFESEEINYESENRSCIEKAG